MFDKLKNSLDEGRRRYGTIRNAKQVSATKCVCSDDGEGKEDYPCPVHNKEAFAEAVRDGEVEVANRKNARLNESECEECGESPAKKYSMEGHIAQTLCEVCAEQKGYLKNSGDRDAGDYAKCASCGHEKALHTEGDGKCYTCGCADFKNSLKNAAGRLIVAGGDSDKVAFVHCQTCDEGINESKIQEHISDGHTVEKVMKVENGLANSYQFRVVDKDVTCAECGKQVTNIAIDPALDGAIVCAPCYKKIMREIQNEIKNDAPPLPPGGLGYDYQTSTTTATPGKGNCPECGHTISQKFYEGTCQCLCHSERKNNGGPAGCPGCGSHQYEIADGADKVKCLDCGKISDLTLWNTVCDVCRREEGAALEEHLMTRHGMEPDVASVVAMDMERRSL